jgi:flagellar biosynthetic protein FliP
MRDNSRTPRSVRARLVVLSAAKDLAQRRPAPTTALRKSTSVLRTALIVLATTSVLVSIYVGTARAQDTQPPANRATLLDTATPTTPPAQSNTDPAQLVDRWTSRQGLSSALQIMLLLTVISVAPALLLMTTSFVRIVVVLGLLRQALGTQQLPPSQVITSLALFISLLVMAPVWKQVYDDAIGPYTQEKIGLEEAWQRGQAPVRRFMSAQIQRAGNEDDVHLFLDYLDPPRSAGPDQRPKYVYYGARAEEGEQDVPLQALLPGFMLSELKTSFVIGFQIYLPFLILDLVVSSVLISMGMLMLPPVLISLPFKLLLFVLVDGWHLVVEMLMASFEPFL